MKYLVLILLFVSSVVFAGEFSPFIEANITHTPLPSDGTYYQDRFDHKEKMNTFGYSLGVTYQTDRFDYILAYDKLGRKEIKSYGVPDNEYSQLSDDGLIPGNSCNCSGYFSTKEEISGIRLALGTSKKLSPLYAEAGLFAYKSALRMTLITIPTHQTIKLETDKKLQIGWEISAGYRVTDNITIMSRYYKLGGSDGMPIMAEDTFLFGVRINF